MAFRKSRLMQTVERRFGKPIEELLPELYYDRNWPHHKVAAHISMVIETPVSEDALYKWWRKIRDEAAEPAEALAVS